jgi:dUTP pyrophosphatase
MDTYYNIHKNLIKSYGGYMELTIYTKNEELHENYIYASQKHNNKLLNEHIDAGFDLFCPKNVSVSLFDINNGVEQVKIDHQIQCSAVYRTDNLSYNTGYYLYPRSSVSKTRLRLANSVGIIDSGYRGNIIGVFDVKPFSDVKFEQFIYKDDRMCQICAPNLGPILVLVADINKEPTNTERGADGFGSTGK